MSRNLYLTLGAVAVLATAGQAITLKFDGMKANQFQTVTIKHNGVWQNVSAGTMNIKVDGTQMDAYCVDLNNWNKAGDQYGVNVYNNLNKLGANSSLLANVYASFAGSVNSKDTGAAFQLALWDILEDGGDGLSNGSFRAKNLSNSVLNLANSFISAKNNTPAQPYQYMYFEAVTHQQGWDCNRFQNLMTGNPVPEPMSLIALAGAAAAALKRRKKA